MDLRPLTACCSIKQHVVLVANIVGCRALIFATSIVKLCRKAEVRNLLDMHDEERKKDQTLFKISH